MTVKHFNHGRFSRAVRTEKTKDLTFPDGKGNIVYCLCNSIEFLKISYLNQTQAPATQVFTANKLATDSYNRFYILTVFIFCYQNSRSESKRFYNWILNVETLYDCKFFFMNFRLNIYLIGINFSHFVESNGLLRRSYQFTHSQLNKNS